MLAYNHEKYISQSIESVLMQETDFEVELVIGEDCSTDGTRALVERYAAQYPNLIRPLLPERNLGAHENYGAVLSACRGMYIAYLEADDYWTEPYKLARQVELLDANPDMAFCFHRVIEFNEQEAKPAGLFPVKDLTDFSDPVEELIQWNFIPSVSRMMRRSNMPVLHAGFYKLKLGDWPTSIEMALNGRMGFLPNVMAVYRLHPESTWSSKSQEVRDVATYEMFCYLQTHSHGPYRISISRSALRYCRFVLEHRRSLGLRANIPLMINSLKIASGTRLPDVIVQLIWLSLYTIFPIRTGRLYRILEAAARALIAPKSEK